MERHYYDNKKIRHWIEKILGNHIPEKGLVSRMLKDLLKE